MDGVRIGESFKGDAHGLGADCLRGERGEHGHGDEQTMGEGAAQRHGEPSTKRRRHYSGDRYSPNDDNFKAFGFWRAASEEESASAVLSDQTTWATMAGIARQSPA